MERKHSELDSYAGPEPANANAFLISRFGRGPTGFPRYRLVLASHLWEQIGGEWKDWDTSIPTSERGKLVADATGRSLAPDSEACSTTIEVRRSQKYPELAFRGWILERWQPPEFYGNPELWYSAEFMVQGSGVPRLGPFPAAGRYMRISEPWEEPPGTGMLTLQVEYWEAEMQNVLARSPEAHLRLRMYEEQQREDARNARWEEKVRGHLNAMDATIFSTTREAMEARGRAARAVGIHSHVG